VTIDHPKELTQGKGHRLDAVANRKSTTVKKHILVLGGGFAELWRRQGVNRCPRSIPVRTLAAQAKKHSIVPHRVSTRWVARLPQPLDCDRLRPLLRIERSGKVIAHVALCASQRAFVRGEFVRIGIERPGEIAAHVPGPKKLVQLPTPIFKPRRAWLPAVATCLAPVRYCRAWRRNRNRRSRRPGLSTRLPPKLFGLAP
jgi:hypothetical protein